MYKPLWIPEQDREDICRPVDRFPGICTWNSPAGLKRGFYVPYEQGDPPDKKWRPMIELTLIPFTIAALSISFPFLIDTGAFRTMLPSNPITNRAFPLRKPFDKFIERIDDESIERIRGISGSSVLCHLFKKTNICIYQSYLGISGKNLE